MTTIAEPHPVSDTTTSDARSGVKRDAPKSQPAYASNHRLRNEIIVLVAFCLVILFVFMRRNYAS
jgi:hypothetical protein